jgi:hypothetical protein
MKSKFNQAGGIVVLWLVLLLVCILAGIGWVINIVKLVGLIGADIGTEFVLRVVGVIVAPLGSIMGWFV